MSSLTFAYSSVLLSLLIIKFATANYWEDRKNFFRDEEFMFLGSQIQLSAKEQTVNEILMEAKSKEYLTSFQSINTTFPPARHFFEAKNDIELSEVFKIIQVMPKGAALHGHEFALASTEYLVKNLTYRENLYACTDANNNFILYFFRIPDGNCNWTLVSEMRLQSGDEEAFNNWLEKKFTLVVPNPKETYPDLNSVWTAFQAIFPTVIGMLTYRPVFEDFIYQFLHEFHADNVLYVEFRTVMPTIYDLDGTVYNIVDTAIIYNEVAEKYANDNPSYFGTKVIFAPGRSVDNATVDNYLEEYRAMKRVLPKFMAGFDLVGQEDKGNPLSAFVDTLLEFQKDGTHFFFHAGETNWHGTTTDENLIDAILLNSTRIGHGFAIIKHPLVLKLIKERGIAIEINPLSNQVLKLVDDLRNHPATLLMADNYPIVISCDDPSFWGAKGLSYDMYEAFMGFGGLHADLRTLKQLALNSLIYSALNAEDKAKAIEMWELHWDTFLTQVIEQKSKVAKKKSNVTKITTNLRGNDVGVKLLRGGSRRN